MGSPQPMNELQSALGIAEVNERLERIERMLGDRNTGPEWLTLDQVAEMWKCSRRTVDRRVASGSLPVSRPYGGGRMVSRADAQCLRQSDYSKS